MLHTIECEHTVHDVRHIWQLTNHCILVIKLTAVFLHWHVQVRHGIAPTTNFPKMSPSNSRLSPFFHQEMALKASVLNRFHANTS